VPKFTFADHYHEKLDIQDNETEYIKHMNRMIKMNCHTKMTLPKKSVDLTLGTQEDLTSISPEDKKIDTPKNNNENLPEHYSNLIFYQYEKNSMKVKVETLS